MKAHHLSILPALAAVALLGCSVPLHAQGYQGYGVYQARGGAYDNGYKRGREAGIADGRGGRQFEFQREHDYRDADWGYDRRFGSRDEYRRRFRDGFEAGYRDGYARFAPRGWNQGAWDRDRDGDRDDGNRAVTGGLAALSGWARVAYDYGFNDGYERGLKAARSGKRPDFDREGWYRDGDRHYERQYGPRDGYRAAYRDGFQRGYDQAYRHVADGRR
jgi:hypothetical protein